MEATIEKLKDQARKCWGGTAGEKLAQDHESFLRKMLADYSKNLELPQADILAALESRRNYSAVNYYQAANFPTLDGVKVFETQADLRAAIPSMKFRCPACNGISTDPYTCNSGVVEKGKVCDWKTWGLFRTAGKGFRFTIKEGFLENPRVDEIFMPVDFAPVWTEEIDDMDNSIWEADSPYHDDGTPFLWRLQPRISVNKIEWYECHDFELMDMNDIGGWPTIEEAKAAIAVKHAEIITNEGLSASEFYTGEC